MSAPAADMSALHPLLLKQAAEAGLSRDPSALPQAVQHLLASVSQTYSRVQTSLDDGASMAKNLLPILRTGVRLLLSDSDAETSEITFGDWKQNRMVGTDLLWVPVSRPTGYWQVQIEDITLNNKKLGICSDCQVAVRRLLLSI